MSLVRLTIQMQLEQSDLASFDGADLMVIPHVAAEREHVLFAMARIERHVEASKDAEVIAAFQWLGGLLARAKFTQGARIGQYPAGRRFDA